MKHFSLLLLACSLSAFSATAQTPSKWMFVGLLRNHTISPCVNPVTIEAQTGWLKRDDTYEAKLSQLKAETKKKWGGDYCSVSSFPVTVGKDYFVAEVEKTRKCQDGANSKTVAYHWFYGGESMAAIQVAMEKDKKEYPEILTQNIIKVTDCRKETANF